MLVLITNPSIPDYEIVKPFYEIDSIKVRLIDLSDKPILSKVLYSTLGKNNINESKSGGHYSVHIKNYGNGFLVNIVYHTSNLLFFRKNGCDGYILSDHNIPVFFDVEGSYKLKSAKPKTFKSFEMRGENYPPSVYDPDNWWFFISSKGYEELDDRTGIIMWCENK